MTYSDYERTSRAIAPAAPETSSDYDTQVTLRLNRTAGSRLTVSAETGYLQRSGDQEYDGWWVALRTRWSP